MLRKRPPTDVVATPPPAPANDYAAAAEAAFRTGDYNTAMQQWKHAMVDDPQNGTLVLLMAQALFAQGNYDEAAARCKPQWPTCRREVERRDRQPRRVVSSESTYADQVNKLATAASRSDSPAMQFLLGYHQGFAGNREAAAASLEKGLKLARRMT